MTATPQRHILHIINSLGMGGMQLYALELIQALRPAMRATVVCLEDTEGALNARLKDMDVPVYLVSTETPRSGWQRRIPSSQARYLLARRSARDRLTDVLRRVRPNVVHSHSLNMIQSQFRAVRQDCDLPWAITLHGAVIRPDAHGRLPTEGKYADFDRLYRQHPERIIFSAVSQAVRENFQQIWPEEMRQARITYGGVNMQRLTSQDAGTDWRAVHGIAPDALVFGSVGRLVYKKGFHILIQAMRALIDRGIACHCLIAGDGDYREALQTAIANQQLQNQVHLLGYQQDVASVLRAIDVFVLPSFAEGFPLSVVEAYMMGVPVIATAIAGTPEIVSKGGGLLIAPDDVSALAEAMAALHDPAQREQLSSQARQIAADFTFQATAQRFQAIYETLLTPSTQIAQ